MKKSTFKNILQNFFIITSVLLFAFVTFLAASGAKAFAVRTDSMSPLFKEGSVVFVRRADFSDLKAGNIVSVKFADGSGVFTHRITGIDAENKTISTKGDNNNSDDPEQSGAAQIIGRYWFSLPVIGFLSLRIKSDAIVFFLIAVAAALFITRLVIQSKNKANG
ncbi:MAG: signal peptidase I [Clostridiales bacterium]|jgi:signal peptidase I|nr:signal peptidase I [Clostridiales bacterium]